MVCAEEVLAFLVSRPLHEQNTLSYFSAGCLQSCCGSSDRHVPRSTGPAHKKRVGNMIPCVEWLEKGIKKDAWHQPLPG